jgi:hypothetical protein|tara:strand:- start:1511 stop:2080 length:570 start_codon:yes stop_codon:yes gene_type:complete
MSTRIERDLGFSSAIHFADQFLLNEYFMTLSILVETDDYKEQNIALERILHFVMFILNNSVLINQNDIKSIKKYKEAGIRVCLLPEDPVDQIISMTLLQKFNSVTEGRLKVTDCTLGSNLSDGVRFCTVAEVAENYMDNDHHKWWNCNTLRIEHSEPVTDDNNIVKLFDNDDWEKLELHFKKGKKQQNH